jgi:hypothetical protein
VFAAFRWDTRKTDGPFDTGEYNRSENRAFAYGGALKQWVEHLSDQFVVSIIAHSMGNIVCAEAFREGLRVRNYVLMEAAVPMSCYFADADPLPRLQDKEGEYPTPDYHLNPSTNELTLGYRGYLATIPATVTTFYNEDDWALATGRSSLLGLTVETNWEKNQVDYKPDGSVALAIHDGTWSYHYDSVFPSMRPTNERAWLVSPTSCYVTDSWEMKAFLARSRTKAAGAFRNGGPFDRKENLRDTYGFTNVRDDHSGQFTRNIQQLTSLYRKLRELVEE